MHNSIEMLPARRNTHVGEPLCGVVGRPVIQHEEKLEKLEDQKSQLRKFEGILFDTAEGSHFMLDLQ